MGHYFDKFEDRKPEPPVEYSMWRELLWQFLAVMNLVVGAWYIHWRWTESLNYEALWFAIPLCLAETCAYIGLALFTFNLWKTDDPEVKEPPATIGDITDGSYDRPLAVDVFFPTYDEDPDLVRLSIIDAQKMKYPHNINIQIHLLDDGRRDKMKALAEELGVNYLTRPTNVGFKAGNLRNGMENTSGDIIVICDADTRPFPTLLEHTMGYFRDPNVAWVQTPQWFFDIPEGERLDVYLQRKVGVLGKYLGKGIQGIIGEYIVGKDPFFNDPQMFYDVIQRRRNWANASFCCGAGSIHRREAVMEAALKAYGEQIDKEEKEQYESILKLTKEKEVDPDLQEAMRQQLALSVEMTPYKFHVSEDIYTSIVLHSDPDREWKSIMHPQVESKMLSPLDLQTWMIQRFKYCGGTIDITWHDNPVFRRGMSMKQRLMYGATVWSYFGGIWNVIFILSPIVYLMSGVAPVSSYTLDFFKHILPFMFLNELAFMVGTWGVAGFKGKSSFISFFSVNLRAIWTVMKGEEIKFPTTAKERQDGTFFRLVKPQIAVAFFGIFALCFAIINYTYLGNPYDHSMGGLITNAFWTLNNIIAMAGMILAACWKPIDEQTVENV